MPEKGGSGFVEVVGLGQCSLDVMGRLPDWPQRDSKVELTASLVQGGGPVATALVTLARLGVATAFAGKIGDDDFGLRIREGLIAEGIDCSALLADACATSQFAFIAVDEKTGHRTIFWTRGSARPLEPAEIPEIAIRCCRVLHLDGLQHEASLAAARLARENGVLTVLDGGTLREGTRELLPLIDHMVVSERFADQFGEGRCFSDVLPELLGFGATAATITMGEKGSLTCSREGETFHQPAFSTQAVDTTGCGDVFHGGYIFGLLHGWPLGMVVTFAAACAALKTRGLGGRSAIPGLNEVLAFLESQGRSNS